MHTYMYIYIYIYIYIYTRHSFLERCLRIMFVLFGGLCVGVVCGAYVQVSWQVVCDRMCAHLAGHVRYYVRVMCKGCAHNPTANNLVCTHLTHIMRRT